MNQTYKDFETILIDDGSTDRTCEYAKMMIENDDRFILIGTYNCGQSTARNLGLKVASGEFVAFLDADDSYNSDFLKNGLLSFNTNVDVVSFLFPGFNGMIVSGEVSKDYFIESMFMGRIGTVVWNKIFRKNVLKTVTFPDGEVHEEIAFFQDLFPHINTCKIINEDEYNYRTVRDGNTNSTFNEKRFVAVKHQLNFIDWLKSENYIKAYSAVVVNLLIFIKNYIYQLNDSKGVFALKAKRTFNYVFFNYINVKTILIHKKAFINILGFKLRMIFRGGTFVKK
jgi:glycosyltransferase involved in cell wall biosynthesis